VKSEKLLSQPEDFSEAFEFAESGEDLSHKVETFLKKVISSVYTDGVTDVTDKDGDPPGESNNYLLSEDGEEFHGVFHDKAKDFPFRITNNSGGVYGHCKNDINDTLDKLRDVFLQIQEAAASISESAEDIARGNDDLSHRAEQQATSY
jgi:hypothetical protein